MIVEVCPRVHTFWKYINFQSISISLQRMVENGRKQEHIYGRLFYFITIFSNIIYYVNLFIYKTHYTC